MAIQQATYFFNLHGNSRSTCEDIFLSNGHSILTTQLLQDLKTDMVASGLLSVGMVGDGSACSLVVF